MFGLFGLYDSGVCRLFSEIYFLCVVPVSIRKACHHTDLFLSSLSRSLDCAGFVSLCLKWLIHLFFSALTSVALQGWSLLHFLCCSTGVPGSPRDRIGRLGYWLKTLNSEIGSGASSPAMVAGQDLVLWRSFLPFLSFLIVLQTSRKWPSLPQL